MFRSATFKLTLWYMAIVVAISLIFSIVVYHFATNELSTGLHHQTQRIFNDFPVFNGDPMLRSGGDVAIGAHHILWQLVYFNVLVIVLAGFASYFLARRTLRPIEAAHEQQKRFTADVSHELRTPLTSLKMGSEVALMDMQASKQELREALESNLEDAAKMNMLINNLLRLTKLDADQAQAVFVPISTTELITNALDQVTRTSSAKHITIDTTGTDSTVFGDPDSLGQLIVIVLDNAIKYSPEGSTVTVTTTQKDNEVNLTIKDTGQGISPAALPHVFDRFYRADASRTKTTTEGYGLGLSIAKLIADRHTGTITLSSRKNHGTTVTIALPAHRENETKKAKA